MSRTNCPIVHTAVMYVMQWGLYSKIPLPSTFVLLHAMYKYMSEPAREKKGVKQDIKI